jgi:hypothetical protein
VFEHYSSEILPYLCTNKEAMAIMKILEITKYLRKKGKVRTSTAFRGTSPEDTAAITLITSAATLTVSWNWMNF